MIWCVCVPVCLWFRLHSLRSNYMLWILIKIHVIHAQHVFVYLLNDIECNVNRCMCLRIAWCERMFSRQNVYFGTVTFTMLRIDLAASNQAIRVGVEWDEHQAQHEKKTMKCASSIYKSQFNRRQCHLMSFTTIFFCQFIQIVISQHTGSAADRVDTILIVSSEWMNETFSSNLNFHFHIASALLSTRSHCHTM